MKMMKLWMLVAVAAIASACSKQDMEPAFEGEKTATIEFVAEEIAGRTVFGEPDGTTYPTLWTETDNVSLWVNSQKRVKVAVTPSDDQKSAKFLASLTDDESGSYTIYLSTVYSCTYDGNNNAHFQLATEQNPTEASCDSRAQIAVAETATVEAASLAEAFPTTLNLQFRHLTAYGCLTLKNLPDDKALEAVILSADTPIAYKFRYKYKDAVLEAMDSSEASIRINTERAENIWFGIYPANLHDKTLQVKARFSDGTSCTKPITFNGANENAGNFVAGKIAKFSVDFDGIAVEEPIKFGDVYPETGTPEGIVYYVSDDGKTAKVVSLQRTEATPWCVVKETGAVPNPIPHTLATDSTADRMINWNTLTSWVKDNPEYSLPIYDFCKSLGEGWIWPCEPDLRDLGNIYKAKAEALDHALTSNGGVALNAGSDADGDTTGDRYWSTREYTSDTPSNASKVGVNAHWVRMDTGTESRNNANKKNKYFGRAIKVISLE